MYCNQVTLVHAIYFFPDHAEAPPEACFGGSSPWLAPATWPMDGWNMMEPCLVKFNLETKGTYHH